MKRRWGLSPHTKDHSNGHIYANVAVDEGNDNNEGDVMDDINNSEEVGEECEDEPEGEKISANYEEVNPAKLIRIPLNPTDEERRRHNVNHCPYLSWCSTCVEGRGKEDPHYTNTRKEVQTGLPSIAFDYKPAGQECTYDDKIDLLFGRDK